MESQNCWKVYYVLLQNAYLKIIIWFLIKNLYTIWVWKHVPFCLQFRSKDEGWMLWWHSDGRNFKSQTIFFFLLEGFICKSYTIYLFYRTRTERENHFHVLHQKFQASRIYFLVLYFITIVTTFLVV